MRLDRSPSLQEGMGERFRRYVVTVSRSGSLHVHPGSARIQTEVTFDAAVPRVVIRRAPVHPLFVGHGSAPL